MADISDSQLKANYEAVRSDSDPTDWCLFGYEGNNKIVSVATGTGGLHELKDQFDDGQAQFAYLRVISGDAESKRAKFAFIAWVGENVGALKRGKVSVHKASVKQVIQAYGTEFMFTKKEEIDEEAILDKIVRASGANYSGNSQ